MCTLFLSLSVPFFLFNKKASYFCNSFKLELSIKTVKFKNMYICLGPTLFFKCQGPKHIYILLKIFTGYSERHFWLRTTVGITLSSFFLFTHVMIMILFNGFIIGPGLGRVKESEACTQGAKFIEMARKRRHPDKSYCNAILKKLKINAKNPNLKLTVSSSAFVPSLASPS